MSAMYVVQSFTRGARGIRVDEPILVRNTDHARRMAERLAPKKMGVVAFLREGDSKTGEFDDPKLIVTFGTVPEIVAEMERA